MYNKSYKNITLPDSNWLYEVSTGKKAGKGTIFERVNSVLARVIN